MLSSTIDRGVSEPVPNRTEFHPLRVATVKQETRDAVTITFEVPAELRETFRFTQGQYVTLRARIGEEDIERSYSICSAAQDGVLQVGVKKAQGGVFSNWIVENVKPGSTLEVKPPEGRFHIALCPQQAKHYVAFAVGSGITPVLSIIKTTLFTERRSQFTLFYGNRASSTIMFREELAELKDMFLDRFSLIHVMTREHQDIDLLNGRITGEKAALLLEQFCQPGNVDYIFLCGPRPMVDDLLPTLKKIGVAESRIKVELFTPSGYGREVKPGPDLAPSTEECQVTIVADGIRHRFSLAKDSETILDSALRRGIDLRHSCKSGVCATCRAKLVEGQVQMDAHYALEDYEIERGFILTCQSYPLTDEVSIDFDQDN
jgi:ring-1,2-phenylacetyl-CoA epoxidase subunit PaaE